MIGNKAIAKLSHELLRRKEAKGLGKKTGFDLVQVILGSKKGQESFYPLPKNS